MSIGSEEAFDDPYMSHKIALSSLYDSYVSEPVVRWEQSIVGESINTHREEKHLNDIHVGNASIVSIPDANAIEDFHSNYVGIGLRILEIIALAGQYIGAFIVPPTTREDESILQDGDMIYDRFYKILKFWNSTGDNWEDYVFTAYPDYFRTGLIPTRVTDTTFTFPYDLTTIYTFPKRVRIIDGDDDSVSYGTVTDSTHAGVTTVTVQLDAGVLPANLSYVDLSTVPDANWTPLETGFVWDIYKVSTGRIGVTDFIIVAGKLGNIGYYDGTTFTDLTGTITGLGILGADDIINLKYDSDNEIFAFRTFTKLFISTNGVAWNENTSFDPHPLSVIYPTLEFYNNNMYIYSDAGYYMESPDAGVTWATLNGTNDNNSPLYGDMANYNGYAGSISSDRKAVYVGSAINGQSNGIDISLVDDELGTSITSLESYGWIVTCINGTLYHTANAGNATPTFNNTSVAGGFGTSDIHDGVWNDVFNVAVIVGEHGKLATSHDNGVTWVQRANPFGVTENIRYVDYNVDNSLYVAVGDNGKVILSNNAID